MGYPMTFQRFVNRNGLSAGDYSSAGWKWSAKVNTSFTQGTTLDEEQSKLIAAPHLRDRVLAYEKSAMLLLGDLRRLQADAIDEDAICGYIANRTGISEDVVAAVLKEFIAW